MDRQQRPVGVLRQERLPERVAIELLNRDAALWIGTGAASEPDSAALLAKLAGLPWRLVLVEDASAALCEALDQEKGAASRFTSGRGYMDILARDPEDILLPPRALPVYLLNGREDATVREESSRLGAGAMMRRRLNMIKRLLDARPRSLIVVSSGQENTLESIRDLWDQDFRSVLIYVTTDEEEGRRVQAWQESSTGPAVIWLLTLNAKNFASELVQSVESQVAEGKTVIRYRTPGGTAINLDVSLCEKPEFPILDRYDLIENKDLARLLPEELSEKDVESFFSKSFASWRPYAAGLPWPRDHRSAGRLMDALETVEHDGCESNKLLFVQSEPGAGGTTFARMLAFEAASAGYPTLVAKPSEFAPTSTELTTYLFQIRQRFLESESPDAIAAKGKPHGHSAPETPALLVYDLHHWRGRESQLGHFVRDIVRDSRSVVILCVVDKNVPGEIGIGTSINEPLMHQMARDEVEAFGTHINRFLAPKGHSRRIEDWVGFWNAHAPQIGDFGSRPASFWIALEFWLKFQVDLHQSIQGWLYDHFQRANLNPTLSMVLLEVAALSIEVQPLPESLLPVPPANEFPYSVQLEDARDSIPGLGLMRFSTASGNQWIIAHSLLARYFLNSVFADRKELDSLGLQEVADPVALRLSLLRRIATRPELATKALLPLAVDFAQKILKLDRDGNREFFTHWRTVLDILESMPDRLWDTSRSFNHHVAVSRRRIVTDKPMFPLTAEERLQQIDLAIEHLSYCLDRLAPESDGERDLNLLNSLARAYQDRADIALERGEGPVKVAEYRSKATECIRKAQREDPNNSFVLETLARDLLQNAKNNRHMRVECTCEAIMCIHRAMGLESAMFRRERLTNLLVEAMPLLAGNDVPGEIILLRKNGNPIGCVAAAWIALYQGQDWSNGIDLHAIPQAQLSKALSILDEVPPPKHSPLDLRLRYDLVCVTAQQDFRTQLSILDELISGTRYAPDLQQRMEHAILLYQVGRHVEGFSQFRQLRKELAETQAFVVIPNRLAVLVNADTGVPVVCTAMVKEISGFRGQAYIEELGQQWVPFIPRDWGKAPQEMQARFRFNCQIVFGPNGPHARPTPGGRRT